MDRYPLEVSGMGESRLGVSVAIDELAVEQDKIQDRRTSGVLNRTPASAAGAQD